MCARLVRYATRFLASLATLLIAPASFAQTTPHLRSDLWVTDGVVHATTFSGNTIYLGGTFTLVGSPVGHAAAIGLSSGLPLTPYPRVDGSLWDGTQGAVASVVPDGSGGWFLGGTFRYVRGQPRGGLAHIDALGNVSPWNPSTLEGEIYCLLVANGTLYVAGNFLVIDGAPRTHVAAFDLATLSLAPWAPQPDAEFTPAVGLLVAGNGAIYMGGSFSHVNGQPRNSIAAVDPVTGDLLPWTSPLPAQPLASYGGNLYVRTSQSLALLRESTGEVVRSIPVSGGYVNAAVPDPATGTVYLGGTFTSIDGAPRSRLAAIDVDGALTPWSPDANGEVLDLALAPGVVIPGGAFTTVGGLPRPYLASIHKQNGVVTTWDPRPSRPVLAVEASNGVVYAGGLFQSMNTVPRRNAAAIDASTGTALPWNPGPNGEVLCMTAGDGAVYLGGMFHLVGGLARTHFAKVDAATGVPTAWTISTSPGDPNPPLTMTLFGNTLFTGGSFQFIGGVARRFLAAIDASTGSVLPWNPDPNSVVRAMEVQPGVDVTKPTLIYVGGEFTSIGGIGRNYLGGIDVSTGAVSGWNPNPNHFVRCLAIQRDFSGFPEAIYFGGSFTAVNGVPRGRAAATSVSGDLFPWDPVAGGTVQAIVPAGGRVYLGGSFTSLRDQTRPYFGAVDNLAGLPTGWMPQIGFEDAYASGVYTILRLRNTIYVGGNFFHVQGFSSSYFAGLIDPEVTSVEGEPSPPSPNSLRAAPNPFYASTLARFSLPVAGDADVSVYDVAGRRVRRLHRGPLTAGPHAFPWEGTDDRGRSVPRGIYFLRVSTSGVELSSKLQRLR